MKEIDLRIIQGESWSLQQAYLNAGGQPVDLSTGYTATMTIQQQAPCGGQVVLAQDDGITLNADSSVDYALTQEETTSMPVGRYSYIAFLNDGTSSIPFFKGMLDVVGLPAQDCGVDYVCS